MAKPQKPAVDFVKTIRPLFEAKCYKCHGPDEAKRKKIYGNILMTVILKPDGSVSKIQIKKRSGHKIAKDDGKVFEDYYRHLEKFGEVARIPSLAFFYPMADNEEILVKIDGENYKEY